MNAKKVIFSVLGWSVAALPFVCSAVSITVDQVRQRYPWNGLVDIDYTIAEDGAAPLGFDDTLEVLVVDKSVAPAVTNRAIRFLQAPLPLTVGKHRITWDANGDGVTTRTNDAEFHVKIVHHAPTYMVIDVAEGETATTYPVDFLNGQPEGGFNTRDYKSKMIVLRRIPAGSYMAGSPLGEANKNQKDAREKLHQVTISKPFYIGIFEVTQQQYENVMGASANQSVYKGDNGPYHPVENLSWNTIRGLGSKPANTTFLGKLLEKCRAKDEGGRYALPVTGFDLPTDYQWEYACRAGIAKSLSSTNDFNGASEADWQQEQMDRLGRYSGNVTKERDGQTEQQHLMVGSYDPNPWGLYDMHGNVYEWCQDYYAEVSANPQVDPIGTTSTSLGRVLRGGCWSDGLGFCRSASRTYTPPSNAGACFGFRLFRSAP